MSVVVTVPPATEPVSVAEAKAFLRVDGTEEDGLIATLIASARSWVEHKTGLAIITRRVTERAPLRPNEQGNLALGPLVQFHGVLGWPLGAASVSLEATALTFASDSLRPRFGWRHAPSFHGDVEFDYEAGFGQSASQCPPLIRSVLLKVIAHSYLSRDGAPLPLEIESVLAPFLENRL